MMVSAFVDTEVEPSKDSRPHRLFRVVSTNSGKTAERHYWAATSSDALLMAIERCGHEGRHRVEPISKTLTEYDLDMARARYERDTAWERKFRPQLLDRRIGAGTESAVQAMLLEEQSHIRGFGGAMKPPPAVPATKAKRSLWRRLREWMAEDPQINQTTRNT